MSWESNSVSQSKAAWCENGFSCIHQQSRNIQFWQETQAKTVLPSGSYPPPQLVLIPSQAQKWSLVGGGSEKWTAFLNYPQKCSNVTGVVKWIVVNCIFPVLNVPKMFPSFDWNERGYKIKNHKKEKEAMLRLTSLFSLIHEAQLPFVRLNHCRQLLRNWSTLFFVSEWSARLVNSFWGESRTRLNKTRGKRDWP